MSTTPVGPDRRTASITSKNVQDVVPVHERGHDHGCGHAYVYVHGYVADRR
jgi:hypothetical protein